MEGNMKEKVIAKMESLGLSNYGFMGVRSLVESSAYFQMRQEKGYLTPFEEEDVEKRTDLRGEMPSGETIISIAFPYHFDSKITSDSYFSLYALGKDYHLVLKDYLEDIAQVLREEGYEAECFSDNNALPERYIAYVSGVGDIGRNHMVITKEYGSYVFLGEIITNLQMETKERDFRGIANYEVCRDCRRCINACPTRILWDSSYDTNRCLSYITQSKEVSDEDLLLFKGRLFGCDTCQRVCPRNRDLPESFIEEFRPREYMEHPDLLELLLLNKEEFKRYRETSAGWRGKKLLQRNALIELARKGRKIDENWINTAYLKAYYHRLKEVFKL